MNDPSLLPRAVRALAAVLAVLALSTAASAQPATASTAQPGAAPAADITQAPTGGAGVFASDTLFVLHGKLGAFTASARARASTRS